MSPVPDREPRLDRRATEHAGLPREDLSGLAVRQPYRSAGPWLGAPGLGLLQRLGRDATDDAADQPAFGRFRARANRAALADLARCGLTDDAGRLTPEGRRVTAPLRDPARTLTLTTQLGGRQSDCTVIVGRSGEALVLAGPSAHQQVLADPGVTAFSGHRQLDVVDAGEVGALLTSWLGLGPSWFEPGPALEVPRAVVDARLGSRDATAPDRAPGPEDLWERPWLAWSLSTDGGPAATFVNAGSAGHFTTRAIDGDVVLLERVPARNVYRYLVARSTDAEPAAA